MTLEKRLSIIEQKSNNNKIKDIEKKTDLQIKTQEALLKVENLKSRIEAIIMVANKCIDEGIDFPSETVTAKFGYGTGWHSFNFLADGINHHVGFMNYGRGYWREGEKHYNKIEYLGIDEGGFCGVWDFYTNGTETFLKHEKDGTVKDAELKYLNDFLNEFDIFEDAFYKWIDSLAE